MLDNVARVDRVILTNENINSDIFDIITDKLDETSQV